MKFRLQFIHCLAEVSQLTLHQYNITLLHLSAILTFSKLTKSPNLVSLEKTMNFVGASKLCINVNANSSSIHVLFPFLHVWNWDVTVYQSPVTVHWSIVFTPVQSLWSRICTFLLGASLGTDIFKVMIHKIYMLKESIPLK